MAILVLFVGVPHTSLWAESDASVAPEHQTSCEVIAQRLPVGGEGLQVRVATGVTPASLNGGTLVVRFDGPIPPAPFQTSSVQYRFGAEWFDAWVIQPQECDRDPCEDRWFELVADLDPATDLSEVETIELRRTDAQELPSISQVCLNVFFVRRPREVPPVDGQRDLGVEQGLLDVDSGASGARTADEDSSGQMSAGRANGAVWFGLLAFGLLVRKRLYCPA
jgi:hypothetical protein